MLLVLTNSLDATADYLLTKLTEVSIPYLRLNTDNALESLFLSYEPGRPTLRIEGRLFEPNNFSNVWYRRPERLKSRSIPDTPEGKCLLDEWSESLEGFLAHIPRSRWMNFPAANALASRKLEQLSVAKTLGFSIPDTILTQDSATLRNFYERHGGEVIVKPLGRAYIERPDDEVDSVIFTNRLRDSDLEELSDLANCPTLFQQAIRKAVDVRITVVDEAIHAYELIAEDTDGKQRCDIRRNNMQDVEYRFVELPEEVSDLVQRLVSFYGLRFAAIDMAIDENGDWYYFEVNPNGQWAWLDLCGEATIYKSFIVSFSNAKN